MHLVLAVLFAFAPLSAKSSDPYAPLRLYDGSWRVMRKGAGKPEVLVNHCALLGQFFACGQNVNGSPGGLVVFIPVNGQPGRFHTTTIMPEGRATSLDELQIQGNQWIYTSRRDQDGVATYYRTINSFGDKNHIHFESSESANNKDWTVKNSGEETRTAVGLRHTQ